MKFLIPDTITDYTEDDKELLIRLAEDNQCAFSIIYIRYHAILYTFILRYVKNPHTAEEILQQIFVKLWELRKAIYIHTTLKSYLYAMGRNTVLNYIRNSQRAMLHNYKIAQIIPDSEDESARFSSDPTIIDYLEKAIRQLPLQQRTVITMRREGLKAKEIADKMSISIHTVNTHYRDGIKTLRALLSRIMLPILIFLYHIPL